MNEITNTKLMTIDDVANSLNCGHETVRLYANKLGFTKNGVKTLLNEKQVTLILDELKKSNNNQYDLPEQLLKVSTSLTPALKIKQAMEMMQSAYEEELAILSAKNTELTTQNNELGCENKVLNNTISNLMHVNKNYTVTEIAKETGFKSAQILNEILCKKGIQYKINGTWVPTSQYSECGYFVIKQEVLENGAVIYDRKITPEGRLFILNLLKKEVQ